MADRPALFPGLLGGVASLGTEGGLLAGALTLALNRVPVPRVPRRGATVLFPLLVTAVTGASSSGASERCSAP